ncbi:MAG: hypothetical protein JO332_12370 [Planctomycetaceae bacterium]|nr:hypothetical protein [Planctomycetaceae bacterium]
MREVTVETLRGEVIRLGAVVVQTRVLHLNGARLHAPGTVLGSGEIRSLQETGVKSVILLEAGESEPAAQKELATEAVEAWSLAVGDVLVEDLRDHTGRVALANGTIIDPVMLQAGIPGGNGRIKIRRRGLRGADEQVKAYLSRLPPASPRAPRPDSRVTRTTEASAGPLKILLVPRARVLVTVADNFQRSFMLNTFASEGHEVFDRRWADVSQGDLHQMKIDALVLDLMEAPTALPMLRKTDLFRNLAVLVAGAEDRKAEVFKALSNGANGSIPMPPRRDLLLERLRGTIQALGKRVTVKPALIRERRAMPREGGHFVCTVADPFLKQPIPIRQVTALDLGENGMRIEYPRPAWPQPHAYLSHGVHPQHFCFNYAKDNPLGRDLTVTLPPAAGREMQISAKFVHVSLNSDYETAGLVFHRVKGSVRDHISTVRGQVGSTSRIAPPSTTRGKAF